MAKDLNGNDIETEVVHHGSHWTVFLPMQAGVDVVPIKNGLFLACGLHSPSSCSHVRAVLKAMDSNG